MSAFSLFGSEMPYIFAEVDLQNFLVGIFIIASTIAYLIWLVKRKL